MRKMSRRRKDGIFYQLHYFSYFHFSLGFVLSSTESWKKEGKPLRNSIMLSVPSFTDFMERRIDVLIGSVGTDGARTRSFRLDRAVLWPIELQSQGNKKRSSRNFGFLFILSYQVFIKNKSVLPSDSRLTNCWAELDLNQRRHIVNEFTVRPH